MSGPGPPKGGSGVTPPPPEEEWREVFTRGTLEKTGVKKISAKKGFKKFQTQRDRGVPPPPGGAGQASFKGRTHPPTPRPGGVTDLKRKPGQLRPGVYEGVGPLDSHGLRLPEELGVLGAGSGDGIKAGGECLGKPSFEPWGIVPTPHRGDPGGPKTRIKNGLLEEEKTTFGQSQKNRGATRTRTLP